MRRVRRRDLPSPFESAKSWPHQNRKMQSRFGTLWYNPNFLQLWMGLTISYLDHARRYRLGMGLSSIQEEMFPPDGESHASSMSIRIRALAYKIFLDAQIYQKRKAQTLRKEAQLYQK
jgi:hypothetical protein